MLQERSESCFLLKSERQTDRKNAHLRSGARKRKGDWWLIDSHKKIVMTSSVEKSTGDAIFQNRFSASEPSRSFRAAILILKPARALRIHIQRSKFPANQVKRATWTKSSLQHELVSCKSNLQLAYDCRVRHEKCRGLLKHVLRPIYTVRFLLTIVACNFCSARCSRHGKIVYHLQGPVSRKHRKLFGPARPFSIVRILKTKKCIGMKLCMKGKFAHIKNM